MEEGTIKISKERLAHLLRREQELKLLENGGVDDWEWYGDSLNPDDGITYDDITDMSDDEVIEKFL